MFQYVLTAIEHATLNDLATMGCGCMVELCLVIFVKSVVKRRWWFFSDFPYDADVFDGMFLAVTAELIPFSLSFMDFLMDFVGWLVTGSFTSAIQWPPRMYWMAAGMVLGALYWLVCMVFGNIFVGTAVQSESSLGSVLRGIVLFGGLPLVFILVRYGQWVAAFCVLAVFVGVVFPIVRERERTYAWFL